jgi:hypothetical protein
MVHDQRLAGLAAYPAVASIGIDPLRAQLDSAPPSS